MNPVFLTTKLKFQSRITMSPLHTNKGKRDELFGLKAYYIN